MSIPNSQFIPPPEFCHSYHAFLFYISSMQFSQLCLTLCDPMDCSVPGLPVHQSPGVYSNLCLSNWWCHPTISSSVIPLFSHLQSLPASGSFQMSQLLSSDGQSTGVSASASVIPMNTQDWSLPGWTGWISLQSKGLKSLLQHHSSKASILQCSAFFIVNFHIHTWLMEKP